MKEVDYMTTEKIYAQVLKALEALRTDGNSAVALFDKISEKENLTAKSVENSSIFAGDAGTTLYALKLSLEEDLKEAQAKKNGKKNYAAVKRLMASCTKLAESYGKEFLKTAHKTSDGKFFCMSGYYFYLSNSSDGLTFAPFETDEVKEKAEEMYGTIRNFETNGKTIEIPYTVAQLKAWKKQSKQNIVFSLGEYRVNAYTGEGSYIGINVDNLIMAMEITGSNIIQTNIEKGCLAMENSEGDRVGIMAVKTAIPKMPKI